MACGLSGSGESTSETRPLSCQSIWSAIGQRGRDRQTSTSYDIYSINSSRSCVVSHNATFDILVDLQLQECVSLHENTFSLVLYSELLTLVNSWVFVRIWYLWKRTTLLIESYLYVDRTSTATDYVLLQLIPVSSVCFQVLDTLCTRKQMDRSRWMGSSVGIFSAFQALSM